MDQEEQQERQKAEYQQKLQQQKWSWAWTTHISDVKITTYFFSKLQPSVCQLITT